MADITAQKNISETTPIVVGESTATTRPSVEMREVRKENIKEAQALLPFYRLSPLILQWILWPFVRPLFHFFIKFHILGLENLKALPEGVIFAANHSSELDPIVVPAALPFFSRFRPFFYTSRERALYVRKHWYQHFYGENLFKLFGAYPVIIGIRNYALSLASHIKLIKERKSVIIFPEGGITLDGSLREGKGGLMFLAEKTGAPIIPVAIDGTYKITFRDFFYRQRKVKIAFGKPIYAKDIFSTGYVKVQEYRPATQIVMKEITKLKKNLQTA